MRTLAQKTPQTTAAKSEASRRAHVEQGRAASPIHQLQRRMGNQALQRMLQAHARVATEDAPARDSARAHPDASQTVVRGDAPVGLQPKLTINAPGDVYEQEADRVAEQVMRMPEPGRSSASGYPKRGGGENSHAHVQTKSVQPSGSGGAAAPPIVHDVLRSPGQPLHAATRAFMEPRFGRDFGHVRVHTDAQAAESAQAVSALAYTVGTHISFQDGKYQPHAPAGQRLLAHELAHTIQQSPRQTGKRNSWLSTTLHRLMRQADPFVEATPQADDRTLYVRGASLFRTIKQTLAAADVLLIGSPTKDNIQTAQQKGQKPQEYYVGIVKTTSATVPSVKKLLNALVASGGKAFAENNDFAAKLKPLLDAFRKDHPNTFSNLQIQKIIDQPAIVVNDHNSCIEVMNKCIENIYGSDRLKKEDLSSTAFGTIDKLQASKMVAAEKTISLDYVGTGRFKIRMDNIEQVTKFNPASFADTLISLAKSGEDGFYVNACSLINGYHSIIVIVKKTKGQYTFEWKDQDKSQEFDAKGLNKEFYGYAAGRYSWLIREKYQLEYGGSLPVRYEDIKDQDKLMAVEQLKKQHIINDLKTTVVARLTP